MVLRRVGVVGLVAGVIVTLGGAAWAHVTVDPSSVPKGTGDVVLTFRVPNEMPSASTVEMQVFFPTDHPIAVIDPEAVPGWTSAVKTVHLTTPISTDDGTFTDVVSEIDWTAGKIPPGKFGEFRVLAQGIPSSTDSLILKALQTYDNGQVVRWIEVANSAAPNPANPAPILTLTAAATNSTATTTATTAGSTTASTGAAAASATNVVKKSDVNNAKTLGLIGIIVGALGLLAGVGAFMVKGRPKVT